MSLKKCKECGSLISTKADKCPQCGNPLKKKTSCLGVGCLIVLIFIAISVGITMFDKSKNTYNSISSNWGQIKYAHGVVNVRSSRNTNSKIVTKLSLNSKVKVDFKSENWYAVFNENTKNRNINNAIGYVYANLLFNEPLSENVIYKKTNINDVSYEIYNEDIYDAPVKTQIELKIIVRREVTAEDLKNILNTLYNQNIKRTGFKYHTNPTNIYIYIYNSDERAESGGSQWIAMISKSFDDNKPSIRINEKQIELQYEKKTEKFGFSEQKRILIFQESVKAEDRSSIEAEKKYPLSYPAEVTQETIKKYAKYEKQLMEQYKDEIANKYEITREQLDEIEIEGINKQWPLPKYEK